MTMNETDQTRRQFLALTAGTGVFKPYEVTVLKEVLDDYHALNHEHGHRAFAHRPSTGWPLSIR